MLAYQKNFVSLHLENRGQKVMINAARRCFTGRDAGVVDRGGLENR